RADGVLPEACLGIREALGAAGEVAVGDTASAFGAEGEAEPGVEAIADAAGEGVLVDLRVDRLGVIACAAQRLGITEHSPGVDEDGELRVQVIVRCEVPGDLVVLLGVLAGAEAHVGAAAEDLPAVGVGIPDLALNASLAAGIGFVARGGRLRGGGGGNEDRCECGGAASRELPKIHREKTPAVQNVASDEVPASFH